MNNLLMILSIALLSDTVIAAEPLNEGAYLSIGAGVSKVQNWKSSGGLADAAFKTGVNARAAVGHRCCNFRLEFEPSYIDLHRKAEDNALGISGHMRTLSTLGNVYYHFPTRASTAPYIGAGAGFSSIKILYRATAGAPKSDISVAKSALIKISLEPHLQ